MIVVDLDGCYCLSVCFSNTNKEKYKAEEFDIKMKVVPNNFHSNSHCISMILFLVIQSSSYGQQPHLRWKISDAVLQQCYVICFSIVF